MQLPSWGFKDDRFENFEKNQSLQEHLFYDSHNYSLFSLQSTENEALSDIIWQKIQRTEEKETP